MHKRSWSAYALGALSLSGIAAAGAIATPPNKATSTSSSTTHAPQAPPTPTFGAPKIETITVTESGKPVALEVIHSGTASPVTLPAASTTYLAAEVTKKAEAIGKAIVSLQGPLMKSWGQSPQQKGKDTLQKIRDVEREAGGVISSWKDRPAFAGCVPQGDTDAKIHLGNGLPCAVLLLDALYKRVEEQSKPTSPHKVDPQTLNIIQVDIGLAGKSVGAFNQPTKTPGTRTSRGITTSIKNAHGNTATSDKHRTSKTSSTLKPKPKPTSASGATQSHVPSFKAESCGKDNTKVREHMDFVQSGSAAGPLYDPFCKDLDTSKAHSSVIISTYGVVTFGYTPSTVKKQVYQYNCSDAYDSLSIGCSGTPAPPPGTRAFIAYELIRQIPTAFPKITSSIRPSRTKTTL